MRKRRGICTTNCGIIGCAGVGIEKVGFGETPDDACNDLAERISRFEAAFNIRTYEIRDLADETWKAFIKDERPKTKLWLGFDDDSED